jgi:hypothetical protein
VLDGRAEAHLIALSCSDPLEGRERWSLRLLADRLVELRYVESLSHETIRCTLKKRTQTPSQTPVGDPCQKVRGLRLEDGGRFGPLQRPHDPLRPVVCFDERPCQLMGEVREPLPMKPGHIERLDSAYERGGVCWVLMSFEPLTDGERWWLPSVAESKRSSPERLRHLAQQLSPQAQKIRRSWTTSQLIYCRGLLRELLNGGCPETRPEDRVHLHAGARLMAEHHRDRGLGFSQALPQATVTGHSDSQPGG